jgi:hypothetical protein
MGFLGLVRTNMELADIALRQGHMGKLAAENSNLRAANPEAAEELPMQ